MALVKHTITNGFWKKISLAGQNGKAWMKHVGDDGTSKVVIAHTVSAQTPSDNIAVGIAVNLDIDLGYVLPQSGDPYYSEILTADTTADIYYATLRDAGETCEIIADFI